MKVGFIIIASVALFIGDAFAKPAGCPCSPCTCSPCTCGGHHHDHARVGVGVNVDLSGVGRRNAEADPFAVSGGDRTTTTTTRTQEKRKTKARENDVVRSNPFENVELTGENGKDVQAIAEVGPTSEERAKSDHSNPGQNLENHLANYETALGELSQAEHGVESLQHDAWQAKNDLAQGDADQDLNLIDQGKEALEEVAKQSPEAWRKYNAAYDKAKHLHDALMRERATFVADGGHGGSAPEIPSMPDKMSRSRVAEE